MHARLLDIGAITPAEVDRWRRLAAAAVEPNMSFEPEAVLGSAAHLPEWSALRLLVAEEGDRFLAALVLRVLPRRRDLPVRAVGTRVDGTPVPLLPVLGTPLVDPDRVDAALTTVLRALAGGDVRWPGGWRPSMLVVDRWHDDGPVAERWRAACRSLSLRCTTSDHWARPVLRRHGAPGEPTWPDRLGSRRLAENRRRSRRLAEAAGTVRCVDRAGDPTAVDDFLRLEQSGWKGRAGTALLAAPDRAAAFRESCRRWHEDGRLAMLTLEAGGTPVAVRCAVRSGEGFFLHRIAFDDEYSRFGPGVQLELATGEHFLSSTDAEWMDACCTPGNTFYDDLLPHRTAVATAATALRPDGAALLAALPVIRPLVRRVRPSALRAAVTAHRAERSATPPVATTSDATE